MFKVTASNDDGIPQEETVLDTLMEVNQWIRERYYKYTRFETQKLKEKSEYTIDDAINEYLLEYPGNKPEELRALLQRYLYYLLNTNIGAFSQLLERKGINSSPVIDTSSFNESEIDAINSFIKWDNSPKNKALFEVVNYCIEYATAINSIDPQDVVSALRNKSLYLDNALIYRALGINGRPRKDRADNLLQRCLDSGQKLIISSVTRKEFFETIDFHIAQLREATPYGSIDPSLFRKYTGGYTLYQFYHDWRRGRSVYGFEAFRLHIKNEYDSLLSRYHIEEDFKQQFSEKDEERIEQYAEEIKQYKWQKNDTLHFNDARNMVWLELARNHCDNNVKDTKYYFVTSDRRLQEWDLQHSKNQPITMLPSQWLALLLKYFSQSNDDFKSFVSFLTIPNEKSEVTPEELQDILAGISEITEDFQKQNDIVSSLLESDNSRELRNRIEAKKYAQSRIEAQYKEQLQQVERNHQKELDDKDLTSKELLSIQNKEFNLLLDKIKQERKQEKRERLIDKRERCQSQLATKKQISEHINQQADKRKSIISLVMILSCIAYIITVALLIWRLGWDIMEPITYISGLCFPIVVSIISIKTSHSYKFWEIPSVFRNSYYTKLCAHWSFDESDICDLTDTIQLTDKQIAELEGEV